jgi:hypothetical protein
MMKVKGKQVGLKLNGLQFQVSTDDINLMGDNIKINVEPVMHASKEDGIEVNKEETKYMLMYHHQNAGQNENYIKIANRSFEVRPSSDIWEWQ